jgi:hypothetical protein
MAIVLKRAVNNTGKARIYDFFLWGVVLPWGEAVTSVGYAHGRRQGGRGCEQPHIWGKIIEIYTENTPLSKYLSN